MSRAIGCRGASWSEELDGKELPKLWHLDTASFSAVIAAESKAEKATWGRTGDKLGDF